MFFSWKNLLPARFRKRKITIPVLRLEGAIAAGGGLRAPLNLAGIDELLEQAFERKKSPAVALVINSPGGSPVQSRLIYERIRSLAETHEKQVLVFVEDVAASGGYMIALSGDEIFVDPTSIVGSIGVVSGGFGFPELIRKLGVERRIYTSGENKAILDPFQPEKEDEIAYLKSLQQDIHAVFIAMVKARRGARLADDPQLFSGLFWTGQRGCELGLVDAIGSLHGVLQARYGKDVEIEVMEKPKGFIARRLMGAEAGQLSGAAAAGLLRAAEEKALFARFGL